MRIYCKQCQAVRETVFKCVEVAGRVFRECAVCAALMIVLPVDHLHSLDRELSGATPYKAVMVSTTAVSTGTVLPKSSD
jgi:hypothetical protein